MIKVGNKYKLVSCPWKTKYLGKIGVVTRPFESDIIHGAWWLRFDDNHEDAFYSENLELYEDVDPEYEELLI